MKNRRHYVYPDRESLVNSFACEVIKFLKVSAGHRETKHIAISGGATPLSVFSQLRELSRKEDWSNIHLYWGDERCVPPDDEQSNYGNANRTFIEPMGLSADHVHRIRGEDDPALEAHRYGRFILDQLPIEHGMPVFDWIWLGLGSDGHTASIFPHEIESWSSKEPCKVATHPETGQKRITLTGDLINAARRISFVVAGKSKAHIVNEIVMKEGRYREYPAFRIAPETGVLEWFMDQDATSWM